MAPPPFTTGDSFLLERVFAEMDMLLREPACTGEWLQQEPVFTTGDSFLWERAFAGTVWFLQEPACAWGMFNTSRLNRCKFGNIRSPENET